MPSRSELFPATQFVRRVSRTAWLAACFSASVKRQSGKSRSRMRSRSMSARPKRSQRWAARVDLPLPGRPQSITTLDFTASSEVLGALLVVHTALREVGEHVTVASVHGTHVLRRMHAGHVVGPV